ncbi:MAG: hypothetical protein AAF688_13135, partial [Bacteroidota bacterium]
KISLYNQYTLQKKTLCVMNFSFQTPQRLINSYFKQINYNVVNFREMVFVVVLYRYIDKMYGF